jgi:hypothetical protein
LPTETSKAENHLAKVSYDLIVAEQYSPVINVLEFSLQPVMKFTQDKVRLVCTINLAQAHKWRGDAAKCEKILKDRDWSAASDDFLLAVAVLEERNSDAAKFMRKIGPKGTPNKDDYDSWPLFKNFRETQEFVRAYTDNFGTNTKVQEISKKTFGNDTSILSIEAAKESVSGPTPQKSASSNNRMRRLRKPRRKKRR